MRDENEREYTGREKPSLPSPRDGQKVADIKASFWGWNFLRAEQESKSEEQQKQNQKQKFYVRSKLINARTRDTGHRRKKKRTHTETLALRACLIY